MKIRKILKYSLNGDFIEICDSIKNACESVSLKSHSGIIRCCNMEKNANSTGGFQWRYYEENFSIKIDSAIKRGEKFSELYGKGTDGRKLVNDKTKETYIKKYGVLHHMHMDSHKMIGDDNPSKRIDIRNKIANTERITKSSDYIQNYIKDPLFFVSLTDDDLFEIDNIICKHRFTINRQLLSLRVKNNNTICTICNSPLSNQRSEIEVFLCKRLESRGIILERNVRGLLHTKHELDIYIPDRSLGIEINGIKFHNELYGKNKQYHLHKTEIFNSIGIDVLQFYDDEIEKNIDIVESIIFNKLGYSNRIYARKCTIKRIANIDCLNFSELNHIQGKVNAEFSYGLFYKDELVSIMSFSGLRIVTGGIKKPGEYELLRFCNKINYSIIGGASKLLNYFINEIEPIKIISYANRRWSNGNLYKKLGFTFIKNTDPGYSFFYKNKRVHRYKLRKSELTKMGYDSNKKTSEILEDIGAYKIWDCGNKLYEWNKK